MPSGADRLCPGPSGFGPDELILDPEAWMHLWMAENFHKERIFMIVTSHKMCEVNISLYAYM